MLLNKNFTFIDLFAGIGGFHCAMDEYSKKEARCVFACEINEQARKLYSDHFNMEVFGDITKATNSDIKEHVDVVCGGFPCQTFSKAGMQQGFGDPRGTLFREITRLIEGMKGNKPKILILENVRNLITHDSGTTWNTIKAELERVGYNVKSKPVVVGPKDFGIPQLRERAIILAVRNDIYDGEITLDFPHQPNNSCDIYTYLNNDISTDDKEKYALKKKEIKILEAWNNFVKITNLKVIGYPIWSDEFGKDYPIDDLPEWKQAFITKNRKFYLEHKSALDNWLKKYKIRDYAPTYRKFEWQVNAKIDDVYDGLIQFRPSGIRVKQATEAPTLVAMVHVPVLGKYKRYMTPNEAAILQSFPSDYDFSKESDFNAYKQLGNAVNVEVIKNVFTKFVDFLDEKISKAKGEV